MMDHSRNALVALYAHEKETGPYNGGVGSAA